VKRQGFDQHHLRESGRTGWPPPGGGLRARRPGSCGNAIGFEPPNTPIDLATISPAGARTREPPRTAPRTGRHVPLRWLNLPSTPRSTDHDESCCGRTCGRLHPPARSPSRSVCNTVHSSHLRWLALWSSGSNEPFSAHEMVFGCEVGSFWSSGNRGQEPVSTLGAGKSVERDCSISGPFCLPAGTRPTWVVEYRPWFRLWRRTSFQSFVARCDKDGRAHWSAEQISKEIRGRVIDKLRQAERVAAEHRKR
jgi:hypothetical protein